MKIKKNVVVALTWTLEDTLGESLDVVSDPVEFLIGGNDLFDVIETALVGQVVGAAIALQIEPEQGFGDFNEQLLFLELRSHFAPDLKVGMTLEGSAMPAGCNPDAPKDVQYTVSEIYPDHLVLDGNHRLSGIALRLYLTVEAVREATPDELARGSAGIGFFKLQALHTLSPGNDTLH